MRIDRFDPTACPRCAGMQVIVEFKINSLIRQALQRPETLERTLGLEPGTARLPDGLPL